MKIRLIDFGVAKEHCPFRPHENDAGADVYIPLDCTLKPGDIIKIPLGFGLEIPDGYAGYVFPGSSLAVIGDSPVFQPLRTDQYLSAAIAAAPPEAVAVFSLICPLHNCQFSVSHSDQIHFFAMLSLLSYSPPQETASRCSQHHREASKSRQSILFQPASLSQCPV